ncbi:MAG: glucose 1-dehydrogenase [Dehalococcoidia bacterium]
MRLENKVALITGGSSGIGRTTGQLFVREGARVALADVDADRGAEAARMIEDTGGEALFVPLDVTSEPSIESAVAQVVQRFGRIDVLFNNAGVLGPQSVLKLHDLTTEEYDRMMDVNLRGVVFVAKHVIREMLKTGGGAIVNTASISGIIGMANQAVYAASKAAVAMLTKQLAVDYAGSNIRVNAVAPGFVRTPMLDAMRPDDPDTLFTMLSERTPLGRVATPQDIAHAVLYLASDQASFVTGTVLTVDGGYTAQ